MNHRLRSTSLNLAALFLGAVLSDVAADEIPVVVIDGDNVMNTHADQVGIWIDSRQEKLTPELIAAIRDLKLKSLRYGWQFAVFDRGDTTTQMHSPRDQAAQGFFADKNGRMFETVGPAGIAQLLKQTDTVGFAVCNTDGINYLGTSDAEIRRQSSQERLAYYSNKAKDWATWGRTNRFDHFEIGNENDLSGHGEVEGVIAPWTPEAYATVAREFVTKIKAAHPDAHCGINGGLRDVAETEDWFKAIVATEPSLVADLDFLVAHKYEFWLDFETWSQHAEWKFGRVGEEYLALRQRLCPTLPIHVTELGSWKSGENDQHYRALLAVEMLGNVYSDSAIEHVQFWPSRWTTEGGVFLPGEECRLSPMGLGLKTYSRFAKPVMIANGAIANVRYFATRGFKTGLTLSMINHSVEPRTISWEIKNVRMGTANQQWRLSSPSGDPSADDTTLMLSDPAIAKQEGELVAAEIEVPPLSASVITFE